LGALRRVDTPGDLLGAAKSGLDVFVKRVSIDIDRERPSRARRLPRKLATKSHFCKTQKFQKCRQRFTRRATRSSDSDNRTFNAGVQGHSDHSRRRRRLGRWI
jgi:hypothetical protein